MAMVKKKANFTLKNPIGQSAELNYFHTCLMSPLATTFSQHSTHASCHLPLRISVGQKMP